MTSTDPVFRLKHLSSGADSLVSGTQKLVGNNDTLNNGAQTLLTGLNTLYTGSQTLSKGISDYTTGATQLAAEPTCGCQGQQMPRPAATRSFPADLKIQRMKAET